jgi:hypothetical protein
MLQQARRKVETKKLVKKATFLGKLDSQSLTQRPFGKAPERTELPDHF